MLEEIESLIIGTVKSCLGKEVTVEELKAIYSIYRDVKAIINGNTNNQVKKEA